MTLLDSTIRTLADATAFLAEFAPEVQIDGAAALVDVRCGRCDGSGRIRSFGHVQGGVCFACGGADTRGHRRVCAISHAQKLKSAERARLKRERAAMAEAAEKLAQRAASAAALLEANPGLAEALSAPTGIPASLKLQLEHRGSLTPAQVALAFKIAADAAKPRATIAEGRQEVSGKIASAKWRAGYAGGETLKIVVETDGGARVWGTCPAALWEGRTLDELHGLAVAFTATLKPSDDDATFGFFSRPSKARTA